MAKVAISLGEIPLRCILHHPEITRDNLSGENFDWVTRPSAKSVETQCNHVMNPSSLLQRQKGLADSPQGSFVPHIQIPLKFGAQSAEEKAIPSRRSTPIALNT